MIYAEWYKILYYLS